MAQPKLMQIYQALEPKDRERFGDFVRSPFHNRREKLIRLIGYIESLYTEWVDYDWDKNAAYQFVYTEAGQSFDELQLNNLVSDLYQLMEDFLAWQQFAQQREWKDVLLIEQLISSSMLNQADKVIRKTEQAGLTDAFAQYRFNQLADQHFFLRSRKGDNRYLIQGQQALELYFLSNQLRIWCELVSRSNILSLAYDTVQFEAFDQYLRLRIGAYAHYPTISIYYPILQWLLNQDDDTWFIGFKEKLLLHIREFPEQEARDIIAYVQNYCVRRINQGRNEYLSVWLEIAQFVLPLHILHEGQFISQWTFKNIVTAGVRMREFSWTETFIEQYHTQLSPDERENAYQYNLAVLYYEQHDYSRTMRLLNKVHFSDPNYYLDAKTMLLKIYYEHNEYEALISLRDTVKIYLLRDRVLSRSQQMLYKNLFSFTLKLYKLRLDKGAIDAQKWQKQFDQLHTTVQAHELIANKNWLMGMIEQVMPK